jgi:hypothetical protein
MEAPDSRLISSMIRTGSSSLAETVDRTACHDCDAHGRPPTKSMRARARAVVVRLKGGGRRTDRDIHVRLSRWLDPLFPRASLLSPTSTSERSSQFRTTGSVKKHAELAQLGEDGGARGPVVALGPRRENPLLAFDALIPMQPPPAGSSQTSSH